MANAIPSGNPVVVDWDNDAPVDLREVHPHLGQSINMRPVDEVFNSIFGEEFKPSILRAVYQGLPDGQSHIFSPEITACNCHATDVNHGGLNIQEALEQANTFADLCKLTKNADVEINFFGTKSITVAGYEGSLDIDAFAKRAIKLIEANPNFSSEERAHGLTVAPAISRLYKKGDQLVRDSGCLTKLIIFICQVARVIFFRPVPSNTQWNWMKCNEIVDIKWLERREAHGGYYSTFEYYTSEQLDNELGLTPDHPSVKFGYGPHNQLYAVSLRA